MFEKRRKKQINPFMPIWELIEKFIEEHGSASALRDHNAFLGTKNVSLEREVSNLKLEISNLKSENAVLKMEISRLREEIDNLLKRIKNVPQTTKRRVSHVPI